MAADSNQCANTSRSAEFETIEDTVANNVKIRYAWTPEIRSSVGYLIILAVGILISWVVTYVMVLLLLVASFGSFDRDPSTETYGFAALIGLVGAIGFVWGLSYFRHRWMILRMALRRDRLVRLTAQVNVWQRFPHRMVEMVHFLRTGSSRRMKRSLRKLAPGDAILLNWPRGKDIPRPTANEIPFEPIDVGEDHERLWWLILLNIQEKGEGRIQSLVSEEEEANDDGDDISSHMWEMPKNVSWGLVILAFFGYWVYEMIINRLSSLFAALGILIGIFLSGWLLPLLAERKWWLVPGGMICRESRLWRKGNRAELITPAQSPLILDMRSGMGYALSGRDVRSFACPRWTAWAVAAGWMSRARTPTMEEVRAFLLASE